MPSRIILFRTIEPMWRFINAGIPETGEHSFKQIVVDATQISDWFDVQTRIWCDLSFPDPIATYTQSVRHINWDVFMDWLSDLSWLYSEIQEEGGVSGLQYPVTLVIAHPSVLFEQDAVQFAFFIDVCFNAMLKHESGGRDFTVILGPVEDNKQLGPFLMTLKARERYILLE